MQTVRNKDGLIAEASTPLAEFYWLLQLLKQLAAAIQAAGLEAAALEVVWQLHHRQQGQTCCMQLEAVPDQVSRKHKYAKDLKTTYSLWGLETQCRSCSSRLHKDQCSLYCTQPLQHRRACLGSATPVCES